MACFYVYSESSEDLKKSSEDLKKLSYGDNDGIIKWPTLQGIKQAVWDNNRGKFVRYHASYTEEMNSKLNEIRKTAEKKSGQSVTSIVEGKKSNQDSDSKITKFMNDFVKDFGTDIHAILQYRLSKDLDKETAARVQLKNNLKNYLNKYEQLSDSDKNFINSNVQGFQKGVVDFIKWANSEESGVYNQIEALIEDIVNNENLRGKSLQCELPIVSNPNANNPIKGKIDLLVYDNEGNVIIVDFKTSSKAVSSKSKRAHYMQLECYRRMLQLNGVNWKTCKLMNINIHYSEGKIKFNGMVDAESELEFNQKSSANIELKDIFPRVVKNIMSSDEQNRLDQAGKMTSTLYRSKFFNKLEKENYKLYIEEQCRKNKPFKLHKENEIVSGTITDGKIQITYADGTKKDEAISLESFINDEIQAIKDKKDEIIGQYIRVLTSGDKDALSYLLSREQAQNKRIAQNLHKYLSPTWEVIRNNALEGKGILTMYNKGLNRVEYLILTDSKSLYQNPDWDKENKEKGDKIISDIVPDSIKSKYFGYKDLPVMNMANAKLMEGLIYISQFNDLIPEGAEVQDIKVFSYTDGSSSFNLNFDGFLNSLRLLEAESRDSKSPVENVGVFSNAYTKAKEIKFVSMEQRLEDLVITSVMDVDIEFPDHFSTLSLQQKISKLETIQSELKRSYPAEFNQQKKTHQEVETPVQRAYAYCAALTAQLQGILSDKIPNITKQGYSFQDSLVAGIYLLARGQIKAYTSDGYLITGLANGLESSVSYKNPDEMGRRINLAIDSYFTQVRKQFIDEIKEVNDAARKYFNYIQDNIMPGGRIQDAVFGRHSPYYKALIEKDPKDQSKLAGGFRFINPYSSGQLAEHEKEYLEVILWSINRKRIHNSQLDEEYKSLTYKQLKENKVAFDKYVKAVNSDISLLNIPLKPASGARGLALGVTAFLSGDKSFEQLYNEQLDRLREFINPQRLTSYQRQEKLNKENSLEAFNQFLEDSESRVQRLEKKLPTDFEWNFTELTNDFTLAYIQYNVQKKLLKTIDNQIFVLKAIENMTGQDMSDRIEAMFKRVKISVYNDSLVDKEYTDLMALLGLAKSFGSYTKIALRPMLYFKEMTLGTLKNISAIMSGFIQNGKEITLPILLEAASYVYGKSLITEKVDKLTGKLDLGEKDLLGLINDEYAITDRDANALSAKLSADNYGIFNTGSRTLFYNTVRPDWFVRMTIFVAKMIADGTWNAHSKGDDGTLHYDIAKDERFNEFWAHRNDKSYSTKNFEKQKALYMTLMKQFESEGFVNLHYGQDGKYDPLPMAYTTQERNSIKEQIGLLYGYYDHEEKSIFQNETWYNMFTQFLTYLPGDVQKWLQIGLDGSAGHYVQEVDPIEKDKDGNPLPLYWEEDSLGNKIKTTNEKNAEGKYNTPVMSWKSTPMDGLLVSLVKTGRDLLVDRKHLKDNPQQWKLALLALFNLLFGSLFGTIMLMLMTEGSMDKKELSTIEHQAYDLAIKIGGDLDFKQSVVDPVVDFDFAGTEYISQIYGDSVKVLQKDNYRFWNAINNNLSIVKDAHLA